MPYDGAIEGRVAGILSGWQGIERKKMFGGVCYLLGGRMLGGVYRDSLFLRLGPRGAGEALMGSHVRPFDVTGREMKGWVMVSPDGFRGEDELREWLEEAREFIEGLPRE